MAAPAVPVQETPLVLSSWMCPFAQRLSLTLATKGQKLSPELGSAEKSTDGGFIRELEIDLQNKPAWITQYSPLGKVPAVTYIEDGKERVLYESLALIQWADEFYPGPSLLPASPADRAIARIIIARYDSSAVPAFYASLRAATKEQFKEAATKFLTELQWLEKQADPTGPFLLGDKPSLVDSAVAPWLLRSVIIQHWRNVDLLAKVPRIAAFVKAYRQLPEVQSVLRVPGGDLGWEAWSEEISKPMVKFAGERLDFSDVDLTLAA